GNKESALYIQLARAARPGTGVARHHQRANPPARETAPCAVHTCAPRKEQIQQQDLASHQFNHFQGNFQQSPPCL
ncbi:hypothetical protein A2U01_0099331, partial [Trifolium medium]|nr:hypothetical protein [Trifolium medium]